jgi:hypothetical protein
VKFDRSAIIPTIPPKGTTATMTIEGNIPHQGKTLSFEGQDVIKVIR